MSKIKKEVSLSDINKIFEIHNLGIAAEISPLSGGEFNSVYKVVTDTQNVYVIKIAPSADIDVLTYEKNIVFSEKFALEKFADNCFVHIPKIVACCDEESELGRYIIIEFVEGDMLLNSKLSDEEYNNVMFNLGKAIAEFHNIDCDLGFGYLQNGLKQSWKEAYFSMIENIMNDARQVNAKIPYMNKIKNILDSCGDYLLEVTNPSVLHFDLWKGNIFIKDKKLHSIIDCERVILGDPVGDFIHLDYIAPFDLDENKYLIDGYNSVAKNRLSFNKNELIRFYLMRLYLGMIAYVETYYRMSKFSVLFFGKRVFAKKVLQSAINELNKLI